jgi:hypothetical protein
VQTPVLPKKKKNRRRRRRRRRSPLPLVNLGRSSEEIHKLYFF